MTEEAVVVKPDETFTIPRPRFNREDIICSLAQCYSQASKLKCPPEKELTIGRQRKLNYQLEILKLRTYILQTAFTPVRECELELLNERLSLLESMQENDDA